jgi:kynureninase
MAHSRPFAFEAEMDYCSSSYRFLNGTPNIPGMYTARPGYEMIRKIGVDRIRRRSITLTRRIVELALGAGFEINSPLAEEQRGGAVTVNPPGAAGVCRRLLERNIVVDFRPGAGIRVAPHFYNSLDEIDEAMAEMRRIVNGQNL